MNCQASDCDRITRSPGSKYCEGHYYRLRRIGSLGNSPIQNRLNHGQRRTVEYVTWVNLRQRCRDKSRDTYKYYGGRGIGVSDEWSLFENFLRDMGRRPGPEFSIERIDNNKGYCKRNCKWATRSEQARNTRNVKLDFTKAQKIREMYLTGEYSGREIARVFKINETTVRRIIKGLLWK